MKNRGLGPDCGSCIKPFQGQTLQAAAAHVLHLAGVAALALGLTTLGNRAAIGFTLPAGTLLVTCLDFHGPNSLS